MNLVKQIMDQLTGGAIGQLSSLLGTDEETTERATTAIVPTLLSALSRMASTDDGARRLTDTLGGLDTSALGNFTQALSGNASSLLGRGTSLLGSLFGDSMISALASTLGRFTGLSSGLTKSLLGYLMPVVLGKVANQWRNQGGTTQALQSMFADQRENITNALPAGFSLADIPDVSDVPRPAYATSSKADIKPVAASSPMLWLLPLAVALLAGFFLWQFLSRPRDRQVAVEDVTTTTEEVTVMKPVVPNAVDVPDLNVVRDDVGDLFKSLDTTFTDIRDPASAERAMPTLKELNAKIDRMNQVYSRLPEASRATLRPVIEEQVQVATEKASAASSIEGIGAEIKALLQEIIGKLRRWISADNR
jgi:hypothetical protein